MAKARTKTVHKHTNSKTVKPSVAQAMGQAMTDDYRKWLTRHIDQTPTPPPTMPLARGTQKETHGTDAIPTDSCEKIRKNSGVVWETLQGVAYCPCPECVDAIGGDGCRVNVDAVAEGREAERLRREINAPVQPPKDEITQYECGVCGRRGVDPRLIVHAKNCTNSYYPQPPKDTSPEIASSGLPAGAIPRPPSGSGWKAAVSEKDFHASSTPQTPKDPRDMTPEELDQYRIELANKRATEIHYTALTTALSTYMTPKDILSALGRAIWRKYGAAVTAWGRRLWAKVRGKK